MSKRWGWLAAAVLAATLTGCKGSGDTQDSSGPPPENQPTAGETQPAPADQQQPAPGDQQQPAPGGDMSGQQPATPGGEMGGTQPAGGHEQQMGGGVQLMASWMGEGASRKAVVKSGSDEVAQLDPANPGVNDQIVSYLKQKHEAMTAAGQPPKVTIMVPTDMPFDQVGQPLMKAAFRAGFRASEVEYKPGK
ncbi:MAG TPA: hypothetical protein VHF22_13330 [Planctomycetota bacterium]|nr:hypothetical protein [Planctomycetota bacterium]